MMSSTNERALLMNDSGAKRRRFDARGDHERQRTFVMNGNLGVLDLEFLEDAHGLLADRVAVVKRDTRDQLYLDAAGRARLNRHMTIGTSVFAPAAGFESLGYCSLSCHGQSLVVGR